MSSPFSRSMRSLTADGFRRSTLGLLIAATLLTSWAVWFYFARITLYEVTTAARLEVDRALEAEVVVMAMAWRLISLTETLM